MVDQNSPWDQGEVLNLEEVERASRKEYERLLAQRLSLRFYHRIIRRTSLVLNLVAPCSRLAFRLYWLGLFISVHRRFPRRQRLYTDMLYFQAIGSELLKPLRVETTDKFTAKNYIARKLGAEFAVPTLAILNSPQEVDAYQFPDNCVIKPTHGCGFVIRRRDGNGFNKSKVKAWFDMSYFTPSKELNYRDLVPRVIVEPYALGQFRPMECKLFFCDGHPLFVQMFDYAQQVSRRHVREYTMDWQPIDMKFEDRIVLLPCPQPECFDAMKDIGCKIAEDFEGIVRVDFYYHGARFRIGEITNLPSGVRTRVPNLSVEREFSKRIGLH